MRCSDDADPSSGTNAPRSAGRNSPIDRAHERRRGISGETVRKWCKRGEQARQDRSSRPKRLPWRVTEEERAIICAAMPFWDWAGISMKTRIARFW
jgi:hypothetical protein